MHASVSVSDLYFNRKCRRVGVALGASDGFSNDPVVPLLLNVKLSSRGKHVAGTSVMDATANPAMDYESKWWLTLPIKPGSRVRLTVSTPDGSMPFTGVDDPKIRTFAVFNCRK